MTNNDQFDPARSEIEADMQFEDSALTEVCLHCWHSTGLVLTSDPPKYPEVCCHCGQKRSRLASTPNPVMHGPFLPRQGRQ